VCGVNMIQRDGEDMLRVWCNDCDKACWGGHVTCVV
jgi:hypothetical protein